jgi:ureidoacrylate peracid hydrolase
MSSAETQFPMPDRGKCVLIVVDMQNGFITPNGSCARIGLPVQRLEAAIDPTCQAVALARTCKVPIIWTRYTFRADFSDGGFMVREKIPGLASERALVAGSWDQQIIDSLIPHPNELVLDKNRPSSFHDTGLQDTLRRKGVSDVVVCGVTTNCCVESTVRDASQRDYRTFVLRDAVAEYDENRHREALNSMDALFAHLISIPQLEVAWKERIR